MVCFGRESLVRDNLTARVVVRPTLKLHGVIPVSLGVLTETTFTISSMDRSVGGGVGGCVRERGGGRDPG